MAKWGNVYFEDLKSLQKELVKLQKGQEKFCERCAKELAARLLRMVIKRTPVGEYGKPVKFTTKGGKEVEFTPKTSKQGGTLRRGWTNREDAQAKSYVGSLKINHVGNNYIIEIVNPVEYSSYVEFGHRTKNGNGWVSGRFMMTVSEQELQSIAPAILEKKLKKRLGEVFGKQN